MATLTRDELHRLTCWKWYYDLETVGFTTQQARQLVLLRLLVDDGRLES